MLMTQLLFSHEVPQREASDKQYSEAKSRRSNSYGPSNNRRTVMLIWTMSHRAGRGIDRTSSEEENEQCSKLILSSLARATLQASVAWTG